MDGVSQELVDCFVAAYEAVSGNAYRAPDIAAAAEIIARIIDDTEVTCVALAKLPDALQQAVVDACAAREVAVLAEPYDTVTALSKIDGAQIGISGAEFGIAESGTLVEVSTDDATRLVSSLPRTYIGVVYASELVDTLRGSATRMNAIFEAHPEGLAVSYISGPSRTGDIEMILTLGVHGPEHAHAILITES